MSLIVSLLVGIAAGWIAGQIVKGRGFGLVGNLIIGALGGLAGHMIVRFAGFYPAKAIVPSLITAVIGAVVLLYLVNLIRRF
ncbi:MAG: GlsB/YeaQ/YmgE family stress response membrane protein [Bacteroidia bacterium]|nr:GlsB/YeaQ/YmgE family stress response membrane protein [Bacteroidia bacterium]